jgi:hypothetical protein
MRSLLVWKIEKTRIIMEIIDPEHQICRLSEHAMPELSDLNTRKFWPTN